MMCSHSILCLKSNLSMNNSLRICFLPLYYSAKLFSLNPFSLNSKKSPKYSIIGSIYSILTASLYGMYHLYASSKKTDAPETGNLVTFLINTYNQYSGCFLVVSLVYMSVIQQRSVMKIIENLFDFDVLLMDAFAVKINNFQWMW